jgi:hypothetical protein
MVRTWHCRPFSFYREVTQDKMEDEKFRKTKSNLYYRPRAHSQALCPTSIQHLVHRVWKLWIGETRQHQTFLPWTKVKGNLNDSSTLSRDVGLCDQGLAMPSIKSRSCLSITKDGGGVDQGRATLRDEWQPECGKLIKEEQWQLSPVRPS